MDILQLIRGRQSARGPYDPARPVREEELAQILEAARWTPTAHNMQNFEIVVVDDRALLEAIANVRGETSATFVAENYAQLSFSEEELRAKKVGLLGTMFPPSWRTPGVAPRLDEAHAHSSFGDLDAGEHRAHGRKAAATWSRRQHEGESRRFPRTQLSAPGTAHAAGLSAAARTTLRIRWAATVEALAENEVD